MNTPVTMDDDAKRPSIPLRIVFSVKSINQPTDTPHAFAMELAKIEADLRIGDGVWVGRTTSLSLLTESAAHAREIRIGDTYRLVLEPVTVEPVVREPIPDWEEVRIEDLELSVRTACALKNDDILTLGQLAEKTKSELLRLPNFGTKSYRELRGVVLEVVGPKALPGAAHRPFFQHQ